MKRFKISQVRRVIVLAEIDAESPFEAVTRFENFKPDLPDGIEFDQGGMNRPPRIIGSEEIVEK